MGGITGGSPNGHDTAYETIIGAMVDDGFPGLENGYFTLGPDRRTPVPCGFTQWLADQEPGRFAVTRRVAQTPLRGRRGRVAWTSTVFLGLGLGLSDRQPERLFETMVFVDRPGVGDILQWRYVTWDAAVAGHRLAVGIARIAGSKARFRRLLRHLTVARRRARRYNIRRRRQGGGGGPSPA